MFIDSNGKIFGKVSIIDIIVIIFIVVAIGGIYIRFFGGTGKAVASDKEFYYTYKVERVRKPTVDALQKSINNEFSLNEKMNSDMGLLVDTKVTPAVSIIEKTDGTVVNAEVPDSYDVLLTLKMKGRVNDKGYFSPQLREINAGTTYVIKSKFSTVTGIVTKVWE